MSDWWNFLERKTAPKPAYQRERPKFERKPEPKVEPIEVEESTASDSMIVRILGKIRGS